MNKGLLVRRGGKKERKKKTKKEKKERKKRKKKKKERKGSNKTDLEVFKNMYILKDFQICLIWIMEECLE